jgi:5-methylcytosine-specific restriction endonuclease McrA
MKTIYERNIKMKKCDYGCGLEAKFTLKNGKLCCKEHYNSCEAIKNKNSDGLKRAYKEKRKNCDHFDGKRGWSKGKLLYEKDEIFSYNNFSGEYIKKAIFHFYIFENKCYSCGIIKWNDKDIPLEIHHLDGDCNNNDIDNLTILCPNCHSQTYNYKGKGINKGEKVSEDNIIKSILKNKNIRQVFNPTKRS